MNKEKFRDIFFKEHHFSDFYFLNIGYEMCESKHQSGPSLRENYILHFITKGKGSYQINRITYRLRAGDFFIIKPNEMVSYTADEKEPWEYYWVGFSGKNSENILQLNGIANHDYIGHQIDIKKIQNKFEILLNANFFDDRYKIKNYASFFDLLSYFTIYKPVNEVDSQINKRQKYKESFLLYVHNNYYRTDLTIDEISKSMYINSSYLSQIIKEELGTTAQNYLITYRMNQAKLFLKTTDMGIEEISYAVGYKSRRSFTRAFKKICKYVPTYYKEMNKN